MLYHSYYIIFSASILYVPGWLARFHSEPIKSCLHIDRFLDLRSRCCPSQGCTLHLKKLPLMVEACAHPLNNNNNLTLSSSSKCQLSSLSRTYGLHDVKTGFKTSTFVNLHDIKMRLRFYMHSTLSCTSLHGPQPNLTKH